MAGKLEPACAYPNMYAPYKSTLFSCHYNDRCDRFKRTAQHTKNIFFQIVRKSKEMLQMLQSIIR
jgi:hypothetical protein